MDKHKLLQEDVLPAMASNRKVQRLLNEFMDLLSEYETTETDLGKEIITVPTPVPATDNMDSDPPPAPAIDKSNSISTVITKTNSVEPATNAIIDPPLQGADPMDTVPSLPAQPLPNQLDSVLEDAIQLQTSPPASDQMNLDPPAFDDMDTSEAPVVRAEDSLSPNAES